MKQTLFILSLFISTLFSFKSPQKTYVIGFRITTEDRIYSNQNKEASLPGMDTTGLKNLIQQIYKWHINNEFNDFPYKYDSENSNIVTGIDWNQYNENIKTLEATNFFSQSFMNLHQSIASNIDISMKAADQKWRTIEGVFLLWDPEVDIWCGCQDSPENYWKLLSLQNLTSNNAEVIVEWTWNQSEDVYPFKYKVKAEFIDNQWKVNWIEGFEYFHSVEEYKKMMK
ncbi:hypothetical protein [Flammeovirga sp. SJP92]|uniref:hypothetical protein n=1 Tax=Flammeovirga sp. SJP92 TaxID=1775430 RepID=UPI0012FAE7D5|nr:hypothetical protein [Flammeovirga sp. SJP92]